MGTYDLPAEPFHACCPEMWKVPIRRASARISTYDISAEPFHDCCPVFMPRAPALHTSAEELARAEATLDIPALVLRGVERATIEPFRYGAGRVEQVKSLRAAKASNLKE